MKKTIDDQKQKIQSSISALVFALPNLNRRLTERAINLKQNLMRGRPSFPAIAFTASQTVKVCYRVEDISLIRLSDYQFQNGKQFLYDVRGKKWTFNYSVPPFPINFWNELRNPEYQSGLNWTLSGSYHLDELKTVFYSLLEQNDDVLTEYENEEFLKMLFDRSASFEEILVILKKYVFEVNETELWQEQEKRNSARISPH